MNPSPDDLEAFRAARRSNTDTYPSCIYRSVGANPNDLPIELPGFIMGNLKDEVHQIVEANFACKLSRPWDPDYTAYRKLLLDEYVTTDKVVNLDIARLLADKGVYDTPSQRLQNLVAINAICGQYTMDYFDYLLAERPEPENNRVLILMGAGGSGKSAAAKVVIERKTGHGIIFERVSSRLNEIEGSITRILQAGWHIDLRLVLRKPEDLFNARIEEGALTGKIEPLNQLAMRYAHCISVYRAVTKLNDDPRVDTRVVTNFGIAPRDMRILDASELSWEILGFSPNQEYVAIKEALQQLAYRVFDAYDKSHSLGKAGYMDGDFRRAIYGNPAQGMADAQIPDLDAVLAGMTQNQMSKLDGRSLGRFIPRESAPQPRMPGWQRHPTTILSN